MSWAFDEYELDPAALELRHHGDVVPMEPQVFQVLVHLVEHGDRVVTKAELLDAVWGTSFVSESALTTRIKSARQAVGDDGKAQRVIRTFHGRGYRFVLPVARVSGRPPAGQLSQTDQLVTDALLRPAMLPLAVDCEFPFVGRRDVIADAERLAGLAEIGPQALLLGGEPGLGKSRLAVELATRLAAADGVTATAGRCEQHLASSLQPWVEAMNNYIVSTPGEQLRADTTGIVDRLCPVLPDLAARLGVVGSDETVAVDEFAVVDGIVTLVERASQREVIVVVLDDVQWAGGATRSLASLLLRRGVARVLLVMTFRTTSEDLGAATAEWLIGLERAGASREDLEGLTFDDIEELVGATLGTDAARDSGIWDRSCGHSLFAVELIRDAVDGQVAQTLPRSVASLVRGRLERLPAEVATLVTTGAAFGQEFELDVAAAVADMDEHVALDAADAPVIDIL